MGSVFCCFRGKDPEDGVEEIPIHQSWILSSCSTHNSINTNRTSAIQSREPQSVPLGNQDTQSHIPKEAISNTQDINAVLSAPRILATNSNLRSFNLQDEERLSKDSLKLGANTVFFKSLEKTRKGDKVTYFEVYDYALPEEGEDVCSTCLEEYTGESPKIIMECSHHYHLGCIYAWMERSDKCPICGKVMVFEEKA